MRITEKRWHEIGLPRKIIRWVIWRPIYFVQLIITIFLWIITGCKKSKLFKTRKEVLVHIWYCIESRANYAMGQWMTSDELIQQLKNEQPQKHPPCPCGGTTEYFGEALMGSLTCPKCGETLSGMGIEFIKTIDIRWVRGERGHIETE